MHRKPKDRAGHVTRRNEDIMKKQIQKGNPEEKRPPGRPKQHCKNQVMSDLRKTKRNNGKCRGLGEIEATYRQEQILFFVIMATGIRE